MDLYMGLMSGTSMDGIDAVVMDLNHEILIEGITKPYSSSVSALLTKGSYNEKRGILQSSYFKLHRLIGHEFADTAIMLLNQLGIKKHEIKAIGSHGQTICHNMAATVPYTIQLGCAHTIAERTKIKVVSDFRTRDIVVGGQGAPLAPLYHQALFKEHAYPTALVNIGGIANISFLLDSKTSIGFDLGPGNCLMDAWSKHCINEPYDKEGQWARTGTSISSLLDSLLNDPFFKKTAPKSIGTEYFSLNWLIAHLLSAHKKEDVQATLLRLTAETIKNGVLTVAPSIQQLYVCGGGAHNLYLLEMIAWLLPGISVHSTENLNINPDFIEAAMMAWLAKKTIENIPVNLNAITGSKKAIVLGAIYPAGIE